MTMIVKVWIFIALLVVGSFLVGVGVTSLAIGRQNCNTADLNHDGKTNLADFSQMMYYYDK